MPFKLDFSLLPYKHQTFEKFKFINDFFFFLNICSGTFSQPWIFAKEVKNTTSIRYQTTQALSAKRFFKYL